VTIDDLATPKWEYCEDPHSSNPRCPFAGRAVPDVINHGSGRYVAGHQPGERVSMVNKFLVLSAAALLMGACQQPEPAASPPPPPATSFMVFFDWNSANLSAQALSTLRQAAAADKTQGNAPVTATGHTDRSGLDDYNMALSLRRADAVRNVLGREGVPAAAIATVGKGESQPLVPTADGVREPQNRRVEIVIGQVGSPNDVLYCRELSAKYRRFLGNVRADGDAANAMYNCDNGNPATGIPVLEQRLTDARIPLPPRL
jgi:outer membrane protein OmpA-like peptidoglycan-associated protein